MKLKNIIYIGALLLTATSCNDLLDKPPVDLLSSDGFYQTTAQANQGILGVYADLRYATDQTYYHLSEVRSDNVWVTPETNGQRDYSDIGSFRAGSELIMAESAWNMWYKVIYDANVAIQKISGATYDNADVQQQLLNEAHFLRGFAYFELVRLFGNIPMVTEPSSPSTVNNLPQSDGKTIINEVVIPDLTAALNLPERGKILNGVGKAVPEQGRADKTAAAAMLARVYMTLSGFPYNDASAQTQAKTYLNQVLAKKADYWAPDITEWRKQWTPDYNNKYSIFAIQYRTGGAGNTGIFNFVKSLPPSYTAGVGVRLFGNDIFVEKTLRYEFDHKYSKGNKDLRGEGWTFLDGYPAEANTNAYSNSKEQVNWISGSTDSVYVQSIWYKPLPSKPKMDELGLTMDYAALKDYNDWPCNFPILRIEDMMLLNAELLCAEGNVSSALAAVNEIRERAGCDPVSAASADEALKLVKMERRLELAGEGVRWFDEVRYNSWKQDIVSMFNRYGNKVGTDAANVADGRYIYAIPANQMAITPGLYHQNLGY
jgi:hypothetical protein